MAIQPGHQPEIRFHSVGPNSLAGVSFLPKSILIRKTVTTASENDDFLTVPAQTFITNVYAVCTSGSGNGTTQVSLGQDGSTVSLIAYTNFDMQTTGNSTSFNSGLFLNAGDTLRITVNGTPAASECVFVLSYLEVAAMQARGFHFDT